MLVDTFWYFYEVAVGKCITSLDALEYSISNEAKELKLV